jgi:hypothetical protein
VDFMTQFEREKPDNHDARCSGDPAATVGM